MLKKLGVKISYPKKIKRYLNRIKPYKGGEWDRKDKLMNKTKSIIRNQLDSLQNGRCAYCGLKFGETSGSEIEHIAPKGGEKRPQYPQFTFIRYNLVLSCHLCNRPEKKGIENTVHILDSDYSKCSFNIVHPYFDNPEDHFEWVVDGCGIVVIPVRGSAKARKSIDIFDLNGEAHVQARAKELSYYYKRKKEPIILENELKEALKYKGELFN